MCYICTWKSLSSLTHIFAHSGCPSFQCCRISGCIYTGMLVGNSQRFIITKSKRFFSKQSTNSSIHCSHCGRPARPTKKKMEMGKMKSYRHVVTVSLGKPSQCPDRAVKKGWGSRVQVSAPVHSEKSGGSGTVADCTEEVTTELDPARWVRRNLSERGDGSYSRYSEQHVQRNTVLRVHVQKVRRSESPKGLENQPALF